MIHKVRVITLKKILQQEYRVSMEREEWNEDSVFRVGECMCVFDCQII